MKAVEYGNQQICSILISKGSNIFIQDYSNKNILDFAKIYHPNTDFYKFI